MPASTQKVSDLKKPTITCHLTAEELKWFRVTAAQLDTPLKKLAESILRDWKTNKSWVDEGEAG